MFEEEYDSYDAIPSQWRHLFVKVGDTYKLAQAGQVKTQADINKLQSSLENERAAHRETKEKLKKFGDLDPEEIHTKLDRISELEAAAGDKIDDAKINEMVESRIKTRTAPLERQIQQLTTVNQELTGTVTEYKEKEKIRIIHEHIRKAGLQAKMVDTAIEDALLIGERLFDVTEDGAVITKDKVGVTPGVAPDVWLSDSKQTRPHWWPESQGVGAKGNQGNTGGSNPFTHENWNMTEQGKLVSTNRPLAEQYAKAAGTTIGGARPAPKSK